MNERVDHTHDFMKFVMTPPVQGRAKYDMYVPQVSTMRILSDANTTGMGLGEVPVTNVPMVGGCGGGNQQSWVMPVVIIVVSAMALMTLYAVLKR
jgi:hypothetical protein